MKSKTTNEKIAVVDIVDEVNKVLGAETQSRVNHLGHYGRTVLRHVTLEATRGNHYAFEVPAFFVRVASVKRGRMQWSHWEQKISGAKWRAELAEALEVAKHRAKEYDAQEKARRERHDTREAAVAAYAVELGEAVARRVYFHQVTTNETGPTGVRLEVRLEGTVEEVAAKYRALQELAANLS